MAEIRLPNINGATEKEQLAQMKTYLYQLTGQLNFALKSVENTSSQSGNSTLPSSKNTSQGNTEQENKEQTFRELKNLIIKSADIVNAYYEIIEQRLSGEFVAQSDFGTFKEKTEADILSSSTDITNMFSSIKTIEDELGNLSGIRKDDCYIKTGWLDDDHTIAGVEIGKVSSVNGESIDNAFARFTTDELAFYNKNGVKLGWFGQYTMHIMNAQIEQDLYLGGYVCDSDNGIAFKWVGRNTGVGDS